MNKAKSTKSAAPRPYRPALPASAEAAQCAGWRPDHSLAWIWARLLRNDPRARDGRVELELPECARSRGQLRERRLIGGVERETVWRLFELEGIRFGVSVSVGDPDDTGRYFRAWDGEDWPAAS